MKKYKCLYFCDEAPQDQVDFEIEVIKDKLEEKNIEINHYNAIRPPLNDECYFDILFFDYGGAGLLANASINFMCESIMQHANNYPNKFYVITSRIAHYAISEIKRDHDIKKPANVLYSINELLQFI